MNMTTDLPASYSWPKLIFLSNMYTLYSIVYHYTTYYKTGRG